VPVPGIGTAAVDDDGLGRSARPRQVLTRDDESCRHLHAGRVLNETLSERPFRREIAPRSHPVPDLAWGPRRRSLRRRFEGASAILAFIAVGIVAGAHVADTRLDGNLTSIVLYRIILA
jgi:hypothetical protein